MVRHVARFLRSCPRGSPITLLDTGIGAAEACQDLLRRTRNRGCPLRVVSIIDTQGPSTRPEPTAQLEAFERIAMSPFDAINAFGPGSFDFVCTQLRTATLREVPRMTWLRMIDRLASRGVVWVDHTHRPGLNKRQVIELADRVGMNYLRYHRPIGSPWFVMRGLKT